MEVKEAIKFMNKNISDFKERTDNEEVFDKNECDKFIKKAEEVVLLLKRGEKFEQLREKNRKRNKVLEARIKGLKDILKKHEAMWEELRKKYGNYYYAYDVRGAVCRKHEYIETFLNKLKQKYFPKPSDDFTEKVMEKIKGEEG